jgi:diaminohydroxyphosphoribosylaminopyrimidine deaminase/5-amino-6-(5-phosphoribosylamino)uracil reductase
VVENVCKADCEELNKRFFTFHQQHRPYIILKWAQTRDGFMDIDRNGSEPTSYWITNPALKVLTHKWRSEEDAILVGYNTMRNDRPQLTTREYPGKDPQRFVMQRGTDMIADLPYTPLPEKAEEAIQQLYNLKIQSVIIEGGKKTLEKFLEIGLWDEARILVGNQCWGKGLKAPKISQIPEKIVNIDDNQLIYVRRHL